MAVLLKGLLRWGEGARHSGAYANHVQEQTELNQVYYVHEFFASSDLMPF